MSYILDALRKADAERERGSVPGLHTQSVLPGVRDDEPARGLSPIAWMGMGAALVAVAALAWTLAGDQPPPVSAAPMTAPPPLPEPIAPAQPPAPALVLSPAPPPVVNTPAHKAAPASAARAPVAAASAAASAADERVYALNELPEAVRRELPAMTIGGSIYSDVPASRFLIINGQIFHEGDKVAKDLSLEQIRLKAAVLRFRGYRVGITF